MLRRRFVLPLAVLGIALLVVSVESAGGANKADEQRKPENAVAGLDVYAGLEATLFASEPMLTNPTNIDIDHRGRVWVCDVANYRGHNGERPDGDRILILEDTNGDGKADKTTTFYQGKDLISPQGICVLGNKVIVSASPNVWVFTDENGDDKPEKKEALFTNTGDAQHDHSVHSFVFGPDGKMYFNMGNAGSRVCDKNGNVVVDKAGNRVENNGKPYRQGMVFRCNLDGSEFETLAHNFRNNYEVCVDSFGNLWQSDNDDDGNRAVRINYVMEGGNYGYTDELTGAGWQTPRTNMEKEIPARHWHQNDPGVVPNVLITGAGAPSGITMYEGDLLPKPFHGNVLHCEPGHNSVRCYRMEKDGAGFKCPETIEVLKGTRDNWFRPADVCVAPDGSVFVSDWYDPGVGGHAQGDTKRGRIFRVAPKGKVYAVPKVDFATPRVANAALISPCQAVRFLAVERLRNGGRKLAVELAALLSSDAPSHRSLAMWALLAFDLGDEVANYPDVIAMRERRMPIGESTEKLLEGIKDAKWARNEVERSVALLVAARMTRGHRESSTPVLETCIATNDLALLRECAVSVGAFEADAEGAALWCISATKHDGRDRWYLEALGIGAANKWDACLDAWLDKVGEKWNTPAGRDIVWRSRAKKTPEYLTKIILDAKTPTDELPRYLRAFDFQADAPEKDAALVQLAFAGISDAERRKLVSTESLKRLGGGFDVNKDPAMQAALAAVLDDVKGTPQFVDLVGRFRIQTRYGELLAIAQKQPDAQLGVDAMQALLKTSEGPEMIEKALVGDPAVATATAAAVGNVQSKDTMAILLRSLTDESRDMEVRKASARGLARTKEGAGEVLKLLKSQTIPQEVAAGAAFVMHAAPWPEIRAEAGKLFPPPPARNNQPLPDVSELVKRKGNVDQGKKLYATTGMCAKCHVVGKEGKEVGPALTEIGDKLSRQALYESILFPSAGISHSYETYAVRMEDGSVVTGVLVSRTPEEIAIKGEDALVRTFKTDEVEQIKKQDISLMPADLQKLMTAEELVDVIEYLTTLRK